ncbi:hypothetical protein AB0C96_26265 [Streptomyces sp. NPDC048506]|uniref:hypothetical protein n=1 Tax=Streptomyces sp. NPDC048506 TaxID=3155028 RepID=UPI00341D7469
MLEYLRVVAPQRAYAVHDGLVSDWGLRVLDGVLAGGAERSGAEVRRPAVGETVDL